MKHRSRGEPSLYGWDGLRKYLTGLERAAVIALAWTYPRPEVGTLCLVLAYTGCRISEALSLTGYSVERDEAFIAIRCLKKRGVFVVREIPIPRELVARIEAVHGPTSDRRLWHWSRGRAWYLIKRLLLQAGVRPGPHATAKGLRHAFGIRAIRSKVPLNMVQRWLGHARMTTTAIYTQAIDDEEREIASRMW